MAEKEFEVEVDVDEIELDEVKVEEAKVDDEGNGEGKNQDEGDRDNEFANTGSPHTEDNHNRVIVKEATSPSTCCFPGYFHPVKGVVSVDGVDYEWNSRAHRKLRHMKGPAEKHPEQMKHRIMFLGWEPHIVTWWNTWIGEVANTLWVINGMYATWPELNESNGEIIIYVTGVVGAFMFIITGYFGYIEAINHSHRSVSLPEDEDEPSGKRRFRRPDPSFGQWGHPLLGTKEQLDYDILLEEGYPLVQDATTRNLVTTPALTRYEKIHPDLAGSLLGRKMDIITGRRVLHVSVYDVTEDGGELVQKTNEKASETEKGYRWWTWHPDTHQVSVFLSIIYFMATVIFFIPAVVWYPQDKNRDPTLASAIFWQQATQIVACIGFILVGHCSMAEASGNWLKPDFCNIGWWISLFNTIGSYGFMGYAIVAIWGFVDGERYADLVKWGADLSTFWGSCSFFVAGFLQCFEFGSKHPIRI